MQREGADYPSSAVAGNAPAGLLQETGDTEGEHFYYKKRKAHRQEKYMGGNETPV